MTDVMLNGHIYHETHTADAQAQIAEAAALGGNLSTEIDGHPAWVWNGHAYIQGERVAGYTPIDWSAVNAGNYSCDSYGGGADFSESGNCTHGA